MSNWEPRQLRPGQSTNFCNGDDVLEHDADWLLDQCDSPEKTVLAIADDGGQCVALFEHDGRIDFSIGELSFGSASVRRHVLVGNFPQFNEADWDQILAVLHDNLESTSAVYLLGVVESESLNAAIWSKEIRRRFWVSPHGQRYQRRRFEIKDNLDAYLQALPSRRRKDLRRSLRRFQQHFGEGIAIEVFRSPKEVESFLRRVEPVSARTYQARLLGQGIQRHGFIGSKVMNGARRGWTRCYLLLHDGTPLAWRVGFLYQGTFFSHHVGYDPEYAKWHPGVVMHLYSIAELAHEAPEARFFDYLYGDSAFKAKTCNYYLFPKNFSGTIRFAALTVTNRISETLSSVVKKLGLKRRLKSWIRLRGLSK